jgi:phosphopantothenoylcysteine decarboxylase/phosphopantothenate--cysteine ligase
VTAGRRVLLGVTGGIAAYKAAMLARQLTVAGDVVTAVLTESATRFVGPDTFAGLTGREAYTSLWDRPGEVLHVRLAHEAEVAAIVPCTANVLAKLAHGIADDLLTATLLEYAGPVVIAPAMHTGMWEHPATRANVATLEGRGAVVVGPVEGALAHGDEGMGRLAELEAIADAVVAASGPRDLEGRRVLITAGPTHEPIDPVRFIGNRSSGRMGVALATEATRRGAVVTLVLGPGTVTPPSGVDLVRVGTADELREAVVGAADDMDAIVMAAAVADFRPKVAAETKLKKGDGMPELVLEPTPDVLRELGERRRPGRVLVGFAAETGDVEALGREKLARKGVDLLVANLVGADHTGFGSETNEAAILEPSGGGVPMRRWTKQELAAAIWDRVAERLRTQDPS